MVYEVAEQQIAYNWKLTGSEHFACHPPPRLDIPFYIGLFLQIAFSFFFWSKQAQQPITKEPMIVVRTFIFHVKKTNFRHNTHYITLHYSHLADAFIQSDLQ